VEAAATIHNPRRCGSSCDRRTGTTCQAFALNEKTTHQKFMELRMFKISTVSVAFAITCLLLPRFDRPVIADDGWGTITGQIVVKGKAPENPPEDVGDNPDRGLCLVDGKPPLDDNIIVGDAGQLKDVFVMMYLGRGDDEPTYHPSFEETKKKSVTIDNVKCRFEPHALFVRPGQKVTLKNSDNVGHNCHITTFNNEHNINLPPNGSVKLIMTESDKIPGEVKCDVHKWMDGVILVRDNPYVAITDADGKFKIENIPAGNWKFQFWHKKTGYMRDLEVAGKDVGRRGEVELEIANGKTLDLGKLSFPAESFK
jgi:plastocyanin